MLYEVITPIEEIVFHVTTNEAPYVITKPFHHSQKIINTDETGTTFSLNLILNFEAERELIGFGESLTILKPDWFRKRFNRITSYNVCYTKLLRNARRKNRK